MTPRQQREQREPPVVVYSIAIVTVVIGVCVAIMGLLAIDQARLHRSARIAGEYHLTSSLHSARAREHLDTLEKDCLRYLRTADASSAAIHDREIDATAYLVRMELEHLAPIQREFGDERFAAPLQRVLEQHDRLVRLTEEEECVSPGVCESIVNQLGYLRLRLNQFGRLHASDHADEHDPGAAAATSQRVLLMAFAVLGGGCVLVTLLVRRRNVAVQDRHRAIDELRESEAKLANAQRLASLGHWEWNPIDDTLSWSEECFRIFGVDPNEFSGTSEAFFDAVHPEDRAILKSAVDRALYGDPEYAVDYRILHPGGACRTVQEHGRITIDGEGRPVRITGTIQDITDRVEAATRQRLLRRELDHRVRNNLSAIASLARQSMSTTNSVEEYGDAIVSRITAMAQAHEILSKEPASGVDLREMMTCALSTLEPAGSQRSRIAGPRIIIPSNAVLPFSLVLHELAMNAVRHGAWSVPEGGVEVMWTHEEDVLRVSWREQGGPPVDVTPIAGFGTDLITGLIRHDLAGQAQFDFRPEGLRCHIDIPMIGAPGSLMETRDALTAPPAPGDRPNPVGATAALRT